MHSIKFISKRFDCRFCIIRIAHLQSIVKSFGVQSNLSFHQKASFIIMTFNSHYINIVKSTTGKNPTKLGTLASRISEKEIVATIIDKIKNHPSIISIKNEFRPTAELNIKAATVDQINKIIRNLDA